MFNAQKVKELIKARGIKNKQLLEYMGKNWNGSIDAVIKGDIGASKLEKIADFFNIPIDDLFDREKKHEVVEKASVPSDELLKSVIASHKSEVETLKEIIKEKDKRIETLNLMLNVIKARKL